MTDSTSSRRDFLTGRAIQSAAERAAGRLADGIAGTPPPSRGPTLMLRTSAMACDFDVILNHDASPDDLDAASSGLELVHDLEQQLSAYREDSDLNRLNRQALDRPTHVDLSLFELLLRSQSLSEITGGAFDPATGVLIQLWRRCRNEARIPTTDEVEQAISRCGVANVEFDASRQTIRILKEGLEFNLGAIGKGYAVDRVGELLLRRDVTNWLVHGGRSSIRAQGCHAGHDGWPVGLKNPLIPDKPFATLLLKNASLATSGTAVQWFRHEGRRYGHILDPRTGWPIESLLSVSVIAPDSAMADALSTAFFVLGVEKSLACCDNLPGSVGAIFFPLPQHGQTLEPVLYNIGEECWFPA